MSTKLTTHKMGDFLRVRHGFPFLGEFFSTSGNFIVLTPGNFYERGGFKRTLGKEKYYTSDFSVEYLCSEGDLIVAMTEQAEGLLGSTAIIPENGVYLHNQRIGLISYDVNIVDKQYLYYLFMTRSVRKQIRDTASGTKVKHTSPERIYDVDVFIPNITVQQNNAALLGLLDKKIQLNNRISAELEAMAKTIYDYWFVQFDFPDENGRPYRSSGGAMEWNDKLKREIPKGWKDGNLYTIATFTNGIACQKYRPTKSDKGLPVIKIKEMHNGITEDTERVSSDIPDKVKVYNGDILFSWSATLEVLLWTGGNAGLNQHIFKVTPNEPYSKYFVFEQLSSYVVNFVKMAEARKTTMGHITTDHLEQSVVVLPDKQIVNLYENTVRLLFLELERISEENYELTKLRDWLLPMLMNGQITVEQRHSDKTVIAKL